MAQGKITLRSVEKLRSEALRTGKEAYLWDTDLKGFGARIGKTGKRRGSFSIGLADMTATGSVLHSVSIRPWALMKLGKKLRA